MTKQKKESGRIEETMKPASMEPNYSRANKAVTDKISALSPRANPRYFDFDPEEFFHFLSETGWSDEKKAQYVILIWNVMSEFIALEFGIHPINQVENPCGKPAENKAESPIRASSVIQSSHSKLTNKFERRNGLNSVSGEKGKHYE